jgi:hypothetical protein
MNSLRDKTTSKHIKKALKKLPKNSKTLIDAYKKAVQKIENQKKDLQQLTKQILSWITYVKKPLTTLKLRHALTVEIGNHELNKENLLEIKDMISVCAKLITINKENDIVRLILYEF